eukprot:gnl/TRDRNA2_/TRDRNA2_86540_c2_seq1.p1 gnl/TRDRNA2_/TRDRNA2_86540_c2~~gnl/TRDRNA2_/TRDRNA2_86540_c2_seq1.p1  ORF type:complete len:331 (-),score=84.25 gnl/TRDRNA2_/TRDRNA2_86540_c2_seq1:156-1148(-)
MEKCDHKIGGLAEIIHDLAEQRQQDTERHDAMQKQLHLLMEKQQEAMAMLQKPDARDSDKYGLERSYSIMKHMEGMAEELEKQSKLRTDDTNRIVDRMAAFVNEDGSSRMGSPRITPSPRLSVGDKTRPAKSMLVPPTEAYGNLKKSVYHRSGAQDLSHYTDKEKPRVKFDSAPGGLVKFDAHGSVHSVQAGTPSWQLVSGAAAAPSMDGFAGVARAVCETLTGFRTHVRNIAEAQMNLEATASAADGNDAALEVAGLCDELARLQNADADRLEELAAMMREAASAVEGQQARVSEVWDPNAPMEPATKEEASSFAPTSDEEDMADQGKS